MRPARVALVLALASLGLSASLASAAPAPKPPGSVTVTDQASDANAINPQGFAQLEDIPATKTPVQIAGADILAINYGSVFTKKVVKGKTSYSITGLKVVMTLSAPPQGNVIFRATPAAGPCTTFLLSNTKFLDGGTPTTRLRHNCPGFKPALPTDTYEDVAIDAAAVKGSTITWTLLAGKSLPASIKPGAEFSALSGHTRGVLGTSVRGAATAPVIDELVSTAKYTYGK